MPEERKLVTVLFADVTGSTILGDTLDPEDVRTLMNSYYTHARNIIPAYGGTLEKFIGDAVMAVFGLPLAHSNDSERALAAALALRQAIAEDELLGSTFQLRIGIDTGEVMATSDHSDGDFLVTGDTVNMAARLQQNANPGEIIAGERTYASTQQAFLFEEVRKVKVKGKPLALKIYPLLSERDRRQVVHPPLVGRQQDLQQLALLWNRAQEEQRPQLISIIAPAGTGKTRLLEEFQQVLETTKPLRVATARCLPYGQTMIYWPLRGLLTELLDNEPDKKLLAECFQQGGYSAPDSLHLAELILTTLLQYPQSGSSNREHSASATLQSGYQINPNRSSDSVLGIDGERLQDRESIFMAWRMLIEVLSWRTPHIIIFEDLHWASDSLLDLVEHIISLQTNSQLLLLALSRPELLDRRPNWGGGRQNYTSLALQPLNHQQTLALIEHLTSSLPRLICEQIVERSGGNPFFALEIVRSLNERGLGGERATLALLPDTVHAIIQARLDQLSPVERGAIQVASVAGRAFQKNMLTDILCDYSLQEIEQALDGLLTRDLLVLNKGGIFTFRHIIIRDVAYNTLARSARIHLHEQIATWLEDTGYERIDEYVELIAYHYREAVLLGRRSAVLQTLPIDSERAIHFLKRAAELANRSGAYAEAHNYLQSAITIASKETYVELYEQLGDNIWWTDTSIEAFEKALGYWRKSEDPDPLTGARLLRKMLVSYTRGGIVSLIENADIAERIKTWRLEALELGQFSGDEDEQWHLRVLDLFLTSANFADMDALAPLAERRSMAQEAISYFEHKEDWVALSETLDGYGFFCRENGDPQEALKAAERRLTIPDLPAIEQGDAFNMVVQGYANTGNYQRSIETVRQALQKRRPGQPLIHLGSSISTAMALAYHCGLWSTIEELRPALEEVREQTLYETTTGRIVIDGYYYLLLLALAREDTATVDIAINILRNYFAKFPGRLLSVNSIANAFMNDDPNMLELADPHYMAQPMLLFYNEHGIPSPEAVLEQATASGWLSWVHEGAHKIAQPLKNNDMIGLAEAIDEAEQQHIVVHAARMRIVLAQHTGDASQLQRARNVLLGLNDKQYLRRLAAVEEMLLQSKK